MPVTKARSGPPRGCPPPSPPPAILAKSFLTIPRFRMLPESPSWFATPRRDHTAMSVLFIIAALVLPAAPSALASSTPTPTLPIFADEMTAVRRAASATPKVKKRKASARRYGRRHQRHHARRYAVKPPQVAAPVAQPTPALIAAAPSLERSAMARIGETFASTAVPLEDARSALPAIPPIVGITPLSPFGFAQATQFETDEPPLDLPMWWLVCAVVIGALASIVLIRASEWRAWRASPLGRM
jgi:hypothetical protein